MIETDVENYYKIKTMLGEKSYPGPKVCVDIHKTVASLYGQRNEQLFRTVKYCNELALLIYKNTNGIT